MFGDLMVDKRIMSFSTENKAELLSHPLLTAVCCPPSGHGASLYLRNLVEALQACITLKWGASASNWLGLAQQLREALQASEPKSMGSPLDVECKQPIWGGIHGCLNARARVRTRSTIHLDAMLALCVVDAASANRQLTAMTLQGLKNCYTALGGGGRIHEDWLLFASTSPELPQDEDSWAASIQHQAAKVFAREITPLLKRPMPTPDGMTLQSTVPAFAREEAQNVPFPEQAAEPDANADARQNAESTQDEPAEDTVEKQPVFQRGDSILQWHIKRAEHASRNDRLALDSWTSLPADETCRVASRLLPILSDTRSPHHRGAVVATLSLLTSTPGHVLLHATTRQSDDLCIDIWENQIRWALPSTHGDTDPMVSVGKTDTFALPLPVPLADALHGLLNSRNPDEIHHLSDLFEVSPGTAAWDSLLRQTHNLLMELSDPAFPAYPGRWSNSLSRVFLDASGSDLLASVCSIDFSVIPRSALHYFHPTAADIQNLAEKVHSRLGLSPTTSTAEAPSQRAIPSHQEMVTGFAHITQRGQALQTSIQTGNTDLKQLITDFNELTQLTAAMSIFLIGGRGSRVEDITNGALFCHPDFWWLEDKRVQHEGSSRIVPKTVHAKQWLHQWHMARASISERLVHHLDRNVADRWKELAGGHLRFDAPAFEYLSLSDRRVKRTPVKAADFEAISRRYFGAPKNFMRHALITKWGCAGEDRNLLKLLSGHATAGLAMPAAGAMYTPRSAVLATGIILEKLLSDWLPKVTEQPRHPLAYHFVRMPGGRVYKAHKAHRAHIDQWDSLVPSPLHLAAERIVERVRDLLLNGKGPHHEPSHLWLHLTSFDAIHEAADLTSIFKDPSTAFQQGADNWTVTFHRADSQHPFTTPTQTPTGILLTRLAGAGALQPVDDERLLDEVGKWLTSAMPDVWSGTKEPVLNAYLASCSLWADWQLPPAVQLCYAPNSHAPLLDQATTGGLLGLPMQPSLKPPAKPARANPSTSDLLGTFYKVINKLGDTRFKLGEQKKRAQLFERWQIISRIPQEGELACTLIRVVQVNSSRIRAGKKNAIKFSSLSTYLSAVRPFLESAKHLCLDDFDPLDWLEFSVSLKAFSEADAREKTTTREAALWLTGCLAELGYPIPDLARQSAMPRHPVATTTSLIPAVKPDHLLCAEAILHSYGGTALQRNRLLTAFNLLTEAPLRWGEVTTLSSADLTLRSELCVTSHGYSQLKSKAARRRQSISEKVSTQLRAIAHSATAVSKHHTTSALIFGSTTQSDGTERVNADWIRAAITHAVQASSENLLFRIHHFRAHNISLELCPIWIEATRWDRAEPFGPADLHCFQYTLARAWTTDRSRLRAGHASLRTTLSFYFNAWLLVRALALKATLTSHPPTEYQLGQLGRGKSALAKACSREDALRADPWKYLQRQLSKRLTLLKESQSVHSDTASAEPIPSRAPKTEKDFPDVSVRARSTETGSTPEKHYIWLGLRMLGTDREEAENGDIALLPAEMESLEQLLASSRWTFDSLRNRIKGDINGRALRADKRLLLAPQASSLIQTVSQLPPSRAMKLLFLLQPDHELLEWDQEIEAIAPYFEKTEYCLEIIWDIKRIDAEMNLRLSRSSAVLIGSPAHDVGPYPRIFVQPRSPTARNTVVKARLTTLVRVLCNCRLVLTQTPSPY